MDRGRIDLEIKVSELERTVDALNEVVLAQGRTLEKLESRLARAESRLQAGSETGEAPDPLEERPPHY